MQWANAANGGFSTAKPKELLRPVVSDGEFGFEVVNVENARDDDNSLLAWFERMLRTLRECPEFGSGKPTLLDPGDPAVLALRYDAPTGRVLAVSNLSDQAGPVDLAAELGDEQEFVQVFANRHYGHGPVALGELELDAYGYRWLRAR
jgi:maltose alpha-D-glucosyltransferase/alpha-amylase